MPRPTVFNEQRAEAIIAAIRRVGFAHIAAEINGIHRQTLAVWLAKGEADDAEEPYASFAERYREAHSKWQEERLGGVQDDRWKLEKAEQSVFANKQQVEHSGSVGLELAQLEGMSTEQIKDAMREVLEEGKTT